MRWRCCLQSLVVEGVLTRIGSYPGVMPGTIGSVTSTLALVTDPAYLVGIVDQDLDDVRAKSEECQQVENALSFVRRILHGRLDIVRSELDRRRGGQEPADLESIIARLPELLAEGSRSEGLPRPPQDLAPDAYAESMVAELEQKYPASSLAGLPELDMGELASLVDDLAAQEHEISGGRNELHAVIDTIHREIIRRYQAGDASADSLLR